MFSVGQIVKFGAYQQKSDVKESIEWIVIEQKNDQALLLSKCALDKKEYNAVEPCEIGEYISWKNCKVREWLNNIFFANAFDEQQQSIVMETELQPSGNCRLHIAPSDYLYSPSSTKDKVFLLSIEETASIPQEFLRCVPSDYATTLMPEYELCESPHRDYCPWLLRSPGENRSMVVFVSKEGGIEYEGCCLTNPIYNYIRPAIWVCTSKLSEYLQNIDMNGHCEHTNNLGYRHSSDKCQFFLKYEPTVTPTRRYKNCYSVSKGDYEGKDVIVPNIEHHPITKISTYAFKNSMNLEKIEMPNTIDTIGAYAFQSCESINQIVFPESLLFIDEEAFSNCRNLTQITIPSSLISIGPNAFKNCDNLTSIKYLGDKKDWKQIRININGNKCLKKATKVFLKK